MRPLLLALAALTLPVVAEPASAQIRASEPASMTQTIDGTVFRIDYYRPRVRGRSPIFGEGAVVWEHTWTPGANWATKISFQKDITFEGVEIPAGTYSLWIDLDEEMMPHELFFEPDTLIFHTAGPPPADDQIRFPVTLEEAPFTELLTWDFQDISTTGGVLALRWGTHMIPFDIRVEPSLRQTVTEEEAAPVVGEYEARFVSPQGESPPFSMRLFQTGDGVLHVDLEGVPGMDGEPDEWFNELDMWFLPLAGERAFIPGEAYDGVLREVWAGYVIEFELTDGPSASFQGRDDLDRLFLRATRVN